MGEQRARTLLDETLLRAEKSDSTRRAYGAALSRWWRWAVTEGHCPQHPTAAAVRAWGDTEHPGASTRGQCRAMLTWWCDMMGVANVSQAVERPERNAKRPRRWLNPRQTSTVVEAAARCGRAGTAVLVMLCTGARRSECATLRWDRVDWSSSTVRLWRPKTDAFHDVPLHPLLRKHLEAAAQDDGWVFVGRNHGHVAYGTINDWTKRVAAEAGGVDWLHPHALRRTAATLLYELEHDIIAVQRLLGHARVTTTEGYIGVDLERVRGQWGRVQFDAA